MPLDASADELRALAHTDQAEVIRAREIAGFRWKDEARPIVPHAHA
jgi:hypothetical protein